MSALHRMNLHEVITRTDMQIIRVPGGWLYRCWCGPVQELAPTATFVPFSNEFSPGEEQEDADRAGKEIAR